jgi:RNA polymerase sigma factor (sigma-70 family)
MDVAAFTELVRRHQAAVAAVAFAIVRDRELAHDLAQEAFVKAWRNIRELREPERAGAWLCGIVRFLARDHRRVERRRQALREQHLETSPAMPPAPATPLDRAIARQDDALVAAVVEDLPESYREPLLLHYVAGCSVAEIAAAMELGEDAVKQRLSRARAALCDEPRFTAAALALAPTSTFTDAAVRAATTPAPSGAGKGTFMAKHPILVATLVLGAIGAGGFAIAKSRGGAGSRDARAPMRADGVVRDMSAGSGGRVVGTPPKSARDRAALLQAIRVARARASTVTAMGGGTGAAPPQTMRQVYDFSGEKLVAGVEPSPPSTDAPPTVLNKASIRAGLAGARADVLACYEAALKRVPDLAGTLTVRVVVEGEPDIGGMISSAEIAKDSSTIDDAALSACVVDAVSAIELPAPEQGVEVTVHYPYSFIPR